MVVLCGHAVVTPVEVAFLQISTTDALFIINRIVDISFLFVRGRTAGVRAQRRDPR